MQSREAVLEFQSACGECSLAQLCLPVGLDRLEVERLESIVERGRPFAAGDFLYEPGDPFKAIYAIRTGSFKTYTLDEEGREQVLGFHLGGELAGLEAIHPETHRCYSQALQPSTVCVIPFDKLSHVAAEIPELQRQLFRILSHEINQHSVLAGDFSADERAAAFLMELSGRLTMRGYNQCAMHLTMSRRDIANYLRLSTETVSRTLSGFAERGLLSVDNREIRILDVPGMHEIARCVPGVQL